MTTQSDHTRFPDADERLTRILYAASVNRESAAELLQGMLDGAKLDAVENAHDDLVSALRELVRVMRVNPQGPAVELLDAVEQAEAALKKAGAQ